MALIGQSFSHVIGLAQWGSLEVYAPRTPTLNILTLSLRQSHICDRLSICTKCENRIFAARIEKCLSLPIQLPDHHTRFL